MLLIASAVISSVDLASAAALSIGSDLLQQKCPGGLTGIQGCSDGVLTVVSTPRPLQITRLPAYMEMWIWAGMYHISGEAGGRLIWEVCGAELPSEYPITIIRFLTVIRSKHWHHLPPKIK